MAETMTDKDIEEFSSYLKEAADAHVTNTQTIVPGFAARLFDMDVDLPPFHIRVKQGVRFLRLPPEGTTIEDELPPECNWVWEMHIDEESLEASTAAVAEEMQRREEAGDDNTEVEGAPVTMTMKPIYLTLGEGEENTRPLQYIELLAWCAIQDATNEGDEEKARRIFDLLYVTKDKKGEKAEATDLPRQDVRRLHRQNDPVSKVAHLMTSPQLFGEAGAELDVAGYGEKKRGTSVKTAVSFSWEGESLKIFRPISQYDREVHGAMSSLWADGQRVVTPNQVARAMGIRNPTAAQAARVEESIDLQRRVLAKIDFSQEARGRTNLMFEGEPVTSFDLEGYLIAADKTKIQTANGRVMEGYVLLRAPLIYQHAAILGQVVSYPQRLLELGDGRDTEKNVILRRELLRRVYRIKAAWMAARGNRRNEVNRRVRFITDPKHPGRSLFDAAEVNQGDRHARTKATEFIMGILHGLAERGEISDYKPITETGRGGRRTVGAEVIL